MQPLCRHCTYYRRDKGFIALACVPIFGIIILAAFRYASGIWLWDEFAMCRCTDATLTKGYTFCTICRRFECGAEGRFFKFKPHYSIATHIRIWLHPEIKRAIEVLNGD